MMSKSKLIYPADEGFWDILSGNIPHSIAQTLPSCNSLVVFTDPLTGRIFVSEESGLDEYRTIDFEDTNEDCFDEDNKNYQDWLYSLPLM
jgi:hypothetical protein